MNTSSVEHINAVLPAVSFPVSQLSKSVEALDFKRLKHKITDSFEAEMSSVEWDLAEKEYRRFLALKQMYPSASLVPSKQVDKIWHAHILDTRAYREDCDNLFGYFLDHFPYFGIYGEDNYNDLRNSFASTVELYERHFGAYPKRSDTIEARCEGHACHVISTCACRVVGTCK